MKVSIIGMGYVGLSNAVLLSQKNNVICHDTDTSKLEYINKRVSPIKDSLITSYFKNKKLKLITSECIDKEMSKSDFIIISTPTDFDVQKKTFDTSSIDIILKKLNSLKSSACIVIKSTLPIGYTKRINSLYKKLRIYFSPEFLREGKALYDNLYPSRIIVGGKDKSAKQFANLLKKSSLKKNIKTLFMDSSEAESVKLFSNSYLAARISFFNELDSFSMSNNFDSKQLIDGICSDPRIGNGYNNPSFGYGGYCLPKDTKQLEASFDSIPSSLIKSLNKSNQLRKKCIVDDLLKNNVKNIGIYQLAMKKESDNFRHSSIIDIIKLLKNKGKNIYIHEPLITNQSKIYGCTLINDFDLFVKKVNLIVTNRSSSRLKKVSKRIYTRDIYGEN
tara:strand:+ start:515 stop:1684 length:1170 start_codon:yes stop_codon:yes gene_type:complete